MSIEIRYLFCYGVILPIEENEIELFKKMADKFISTSINSPPPVFSVVEWQGDKKPRFVLTINNSKHRLANFSPNISSEIFKRMVDRFLEWDREFKKIKEEFTGLKLSEPEFFILTFWKDD